MNAIRNLLVFLQVLLFSGLSLCHQKGNHSGIKSFSNPTTHSNQSPQAFATDKFPEFPPEFGFEDDDEFPLKIQLSDDSTVTNAIISIMVIGLNGSGVEETIDELIGPSTNCEMQDRPISHAIVEYASTSINSSYNYTIKLVHIPEFLDEEQFEENAEIISSINSYIYRNGYPDYFLAISRFDDNEFDDEESSFIQLLKQIELLQKIHKNGTTDNIVFLLTNLMRTLKGTQRRPERKLKQFRAAIESYTSFLNPITLVVGENDGVSKYGLEMVDSYTRLPNKELYPKNIWQALINVSTEFSSNKQVLTKVINNREREMLCKAQFFTNPLNETFGLKMQKYNNSVNIGFGYDLLKGELLVQTPFQLHSTRTSPVGYELPSILKCRKLVEPDVHVFKSFSQNIFEYNQERLHYLNFAGKTNLSHCFLEFDQKEGFNMKSDKNDENVTLSSVLAIYTVNCVLGNEYVNFTQEFIKVVNSLNEFDSSNKSSVIEWQEFFETFGSHIVTGSYGGGLMQGNLVLDSPNLILDGNVGLILNSTVEFTSVPEIGSPTYRFIGGDLGNVSVDELHDLANEKRDEILDGWAKSLDTNFVMLDYSLDLEPISDFVRIFSEEKGKHVEHAVELLLKGKLKYSAKRRKSRNEAKNVLPIIDLLSNNETTTNILTPENLTNRSTNSDESINVELIDQQNVTISPIDVHAKIDKIVSILSKPRNVSNRTKANFTRAHNVDVVSPQNFTVNETMHKSANFAELPDLNDKLQDKTNNRVTAKPTINFVNQHPLSHGVYLIRNNKTTIQEFNSQPQQAVTHSNTIPDRHNYITLDKQKIHDQILEKLKLKKCSELREQQKQCLMTYSYWICKKIHLIPRDC